MECIIAQLEHLEEMCCITDEAKAQLRRLGLDQWQKGYPSREVWLNDIAQESAWVAVEDGRVLGAFAFQTAPDASYGEIDGAWLTNMPYASMHRVCVSDDRRGQGVAGQMFAHGFAMARELGLASMRIDTHSGNLPMLAALKKAGFVPCGTIYLKGGCEDGDPRIGFERLLQKPSK